MTGQARIICGDCRDVMAAFPANSIDAIVTDPPYGLGFMGKEWDKLTRNLINPDSEADERRKEACGRAYSGRLSDLPDLGTTGRYGKEVQFWHYSWAIEAFRVLKPGGHLLAMGGTRTFHRLACALEDAGFEIRDCIMWLHSQGFPKSYDISKGFDRRAFKAWLSTLGHGLTRPEERRAISAAVGGVYCRDMTVEHGKFYYEGQGQQRNWYDAQREGIATEGLRLLASLLSRFWEPLSEKEKHGVWQRIVGDHEDCDVRLPPGVRVKTGKSWKISGTMPQPMGWGLSKPEYSYNITTPSTPLAKRWEGWGSGLKPAWEPVIIARKPLLGTLCENIERFGTGGLNIDKCRIKTQPGDKLGNLDEREAGMIPENIALHVADNPEPFRAQPNEKPIGRFPANVLLSHTEQCKRLGLKKVKGSPKSYVRSVNGFNKTAFGRGVGEPAGKLSKNYADADGYETVGAWDCAEDCPVRLLDEQSGELKSGELSQANYPDTSPRRLFEFCYGDGWRKIVARHYFPNRGGASRFFYCAKVSRRERTADGTVENREPTVKPVALGRYLIRLVTPPGGLVLDPFCGSGSFGVAAIFEGFNWIGIDNRFEACEIAKKRCEWAIKRKNLEQPKLL